MAPRPFHPSRPIRRHRHVYRPVGFRSRKLNGEVPKLPPGPLARILARPGNGTVAIADGYTEPASTLETIQGANPMRREDLTEKILDIKRQKGWSWKHITGEIGGM